MLKIRRPLGRLIFNMGIAIPGKTVFLIETAPWCGKLKPKYIMVNLTNDKIFQGFYCEGLRRAKLSMLSSISAKIEVFWFYSQWIEETHTHSPIVQAHIIFLRFAHRLWWSNRETRVLDDFRSYSPEKNSNWGVATWIESARRWWVSARKT